MNLTLIGVHTFQKNRNTKTSYSLTKRYGFMDGVIKNSLSKKDKSLYLTMYKVNYKLNKPLFILEGRNGHISKLVYQEVFNNSIITIGDLGKTREYDIILVISEDFKESFTIYHIGSDVKIKNSLEYLVVEKWKEGYFNDEFSIIERQYLMKELDNWIKTYLDKNKDIELYIENTLLEWVKTYFDKDKGGE